MAEDGSGGAVASSGGASSGGQAPGSGGATGPSGGAPGSGGASPGTGGATGSGGAPPLPECVCAAGSTVTLELGSETRVYDLVPPEHGDYCNELMCQPDSPYATWVGGNIDWYGIQACRAEGDCIFLDTGEVETGGTEGNLRLYAAAEYASGEPELDTPVTIQTTLPAWAGTLPRQEPSSIEFSFATDPALSEVDAQGSGTVCFADTNYICLK